MPRIQLGAGYQPATALELFPLLPLRRGPHILRMCRYGPRHAEQICRVAGNGRWGVQKVCVQRIDSASQLMRKHEGLAKAAPSVGSSVPSDVAQPCPAHPRIRRPSVNTCPGTGYTSGFLVEIFRQVSDRRADAIVHGVRIGVSRVAQRDQMLLYPARFQTRELLGDECLREAWVTLEDAT